VNDHAARWITKVLAASCGVLLLLLVVQYAGLGRGISWGGAATDEDEARALPTIDQRPLQMPERGAFAAIDAHPLFNADREPSPLDAAGADDAAPPANPLNVTLTGVIIDEVNHVRVAMLLDKSRNQPVSLKVGMPLDGDQAAWTLVELKPRVAVFRNATAETSEVELETAAGAAKPAANPRASGGKTPPAAPAAMNKSDADAGDLAKRIEERRRQMREEAERSRAQAPGRETDKK